MEARPSDKIVAENRLKQIVEDIEDAKRVVAIDVRQVARAAQPSFAIRKREAEDTMASLKSGFKTLVLGGSTKVFISGRSVAKFLDAANQTPNVLVINASELYEAWARIIEPSLENKRRDWTSTQTVLLTQCMLRFMETNQIMALKTPKLEGMEIDPPMPTLNDVVNRVRLAIRNTNGDDVNVIDIENRLVEQALAKKVSVVPVPVIISGLSNEELQFMPTRLLSGNPSVFIKVNKTQYDTEVVTEVLTNAIKQQEVVTEVLTNKQQDQ